MYVLLVQSMVTCFVVGQKLGNYGLNADWAKLLGKVHTEHFKKKLFKMQGFFDQLNFILSFVFKKKILRLYNFFKNIQSCARNPDICKQCKILHLSILIHFFVIFFSFTKNDIT